MDEGEFTEAFSKKEKFENVPVSEGEMSPRERFLRTMGFKPVDRIVDTEFGYWNDTLKRWHQEGLPAYVDDNEKADVYFGFDMWRKRLPTNCSLNPYFDVEVISDDGHHKIIYDNSRVKCEIFSDGTDTIPHYLEFPVKDKASYECFKERLKPTLENRIPENLALIGEQVKGRNYILEAFAGSTAGVIRNWMGFEDIAMGIYDQPELLEEILADLSAIRCAIAREVTKHMSIDLVAWWEDIAFKTGPIVTPTFFNESCGPSIKEVMDIYKNNGTQHGIVDCDGDFSLIMPGWLDNGIDIMFPLEVASGIHPGKLRENRPDVCMMGGVDKMVLLEDKAAIKKELLRLKPLVDDGGFLPHVDHRVQPDVSYENYLYYLEVKRDLFGLPNKVMA